jgi:hypothetical protein
LASVAGLAAAEPLAPEATVWAGPPAAVAALPLVAGDAELEGADAAARACDEPVAA